MQRFRELKLLWRCAQGSDFGRWWNPHNPNRGCYFPRASLDDPEGYIRVSIDGEMEGLAPVLGNLFVGEPPAKHSVRPDASLSAARKFLTPRPSQMDHGNRDKQDNRCTPEDGKGNLSWTPASGQIINQDDREPEVTPQYCLPGELWFKIPFKVLEEFGYTVHS